MLTGTIQPARRCRTDPTKMQNFVDQQQTGWDLVLHLAPTSVDGRDGARRHAADRRVLGVLRGRAGGHRLARGARSSSARLGGADDVQGHRLRDAVRADWRDGAMAGTVGGHGLGSSSRWSRWCCRSTPPLPLCFHCRGRRHLAGAGVDDEVPPRDSRAVSDRVLHGQQRSGLAEGDGGDGKVWRARNIVSFVMPTGYSFNLDGSMLYLSLASVFVAQAAGVSSPSASRSR